jgi:TolA-binding protein
MTLGKITVRLVLALALLGGAGIAQEVPSASEALDAQATQLFGKAMELMAYKEYERGLSMLNTVVRDNQGTMLAHRANMAIGKHFLAQGKPDLAFSHFILLTRVLAPAPGETPTEEETELYREALFQAGFAKCEAGRYMEAFPLFRRLIDAAGQSKWADKAYFHIGKSHYNMKNWSKMIDALSMVGTVLEEGNSDTLNRIEIGQRFYVRVEDADIPVLRRLNRPISVKVTVSSGDSEILVGTPATGQAKEVLISAPTELGRAKPGDGKLQVLGGDTLTVTYLDDSTLDGKKGVMRSGRVRAVSTGTIGFYMGDFETPAYIAYPGQFQPLLLRDADLDTSPKAEQVRVTVRSLYKEPIFSSDTDDLENENQNIFTQGDADEEKWRERDRVTVTLTERGSGDEIRSGVFIGKVQLAVLNPGESPNMNDDLLHCDEFDELFVTYTDKVHLYGDEPRENEARIKVSGSINSGVTADQHVVFETQLKARKACVEAEALVGLSEIYKEMGLESHTRQYADEVLNRVNAVILDRDKLPSDLVEVAFKYKWTAELLKNDFSTAASTCLAFNRLYPQSVLADQALMTVGRSLSEEGSYDEAIKIFGNVLKLQNPLSAAEAQFRIGEALVKRAEAAAKATYGDNQQWGVSPEEVRAATFALMAPAMEAFSKCFRAYPESAYASDALRRVVTHYVDTDDYTQAAPLLETFFSDYPDVSYMDEMLMVWAKVAFKLNDPEMSKRKLQQLISDYPQSGLVSSARTRLAALEARSAE